jgi:hypothetical protein
MKHVDLEAVQCKRNPSSQVSSAETAQTKQEAHLAAVWHTQKQAVERH